MSDKKYSDSVYALGGKIHVLVNSSLAVQGSDKYTGLLSRISEMDSDEQRLLDAAIDGLFNLITEEEEVSNLTH